MWNATVPWFIIHSGTSGMRFFSVLACSSPLSKNVTMMFHISFWKNEFLVSEYSFSVRRSNSRCFLSLGLRFVNETKTSLSKWWMKDCYSIVIYKSYMRPKINTLFVRWVTKKIMTKNRPIFLLWPQWSADMNSRHPCFFFPFHVSFTPKAAIDIVADPDFRLIMCLSACH